MIQIPINVEICNSWLARQYLLTHTTGRQGLGVFWNSKFKGHVPNIRLLVAAAMASIQGVQISVLRNSGRLLYTLLTFNWNLREEILTFGASFKCLGRISRPRKRQGDWQQRSLLFVPHNTWWTRPTHALWILSSLYQPAIANKVPGRRRNLLQQQKCTKISLVFFKKNFHRKPMHK